MPAVRVLVAEDYPFFRQTIRQLLAAEQDLDLIEEVDESGATLHAIQSLRPDVVLVDTSLGDASGLDVARAIKRRWPRVEVIVLGDEALADYELASRHYHFAAYVLKGNIERDLLPSLRALRISGTIESDQRGDGK